jgi:hypothetical protein
MVQLCLTTVRYSRLFQQALQHRERHSRSISHIMGSTALRLTVVLLFLLAQLGDSQQLPLSVAASSSASSLATFKATLPEQTSTVLKFLEQKEDSRDLQSSSSLSFWVNYTAKFQVIQDPGCTAPSPVIRVSCIGTDVKVHDTSDPSILCNTTRRVDRFGANYLECTNTCASDSACSEIYLNVDQAASDGPFGTIDFSCSGSTLREVRGTMEMVEPTVKPTCAASTFSTVTRVFNVAQLGVSCPPLNDEGEIAGGSSSASTTRSVIYDDYYFECIPSTSSFPLSDTDNSYTCYDGRNCAGAACTVNLTSLYVDADVPYFQDTCVQSSLAIDIPAATIVPISTSGMTYTARFEAAWSLQFTPRSDTSCQGITPTVAILCYNGKIRFISSVFDAMNCTAAGTTGDTLGCFADAAGVGINDFVSVTYVSAITETHLSAFAASAQDCSPVFLYRNALDRPFLRPVSDSCRATPLATATR